MPFMLSFTALFLLSYCPTVAEVPGAGANSIMSVFSESALVKQDELWDVVGTDKWQINNTLDDRYKPRPAHVVVSEARASVGRQMPYCVFRGNCEHFATELRYGKAQSRQVRKAGEVALAAGGAVVLGLGLVALVGAIFGGTLFLLSYGPTVAEVPGAGANSMMSVFSESALVKQDELWDVVGTDKWQVNNILDDEYEPRPAHVVVREARASVGRQMPYCVFRRNCEHFVTDLRYGKAQSRQVRKAGEVALAAGGAVMLGLGLVALVGAIFGGSSKEKKNTQ
ncbi:Retinoic acid receptor responder protein 3 [Merluccius polli]|uniref:Retinoic acid receptor responder protein 3 n=1 Tax=Merluccius polli TaxID=89951 RepID=A0AA47MER9_MERPO|nr:Retinoic acid receptor responder protein 3 [Merluccius polli]